MLAEGIQSLESSWWLADEIGEADISLNRVTFHRDVTESGKSLDSSLCFSQVSAFQLLTSISSHYGKL